MKLLISLFCILFIALLQCTMPWRNALSGKTSPGKNVFHFDNNLFNRHLSLAEDMVKDDLAAWWTSDSIASLQNHTLDSLDTTWFVYPIDSVRKVFYGRYYPDKNRYQPKYSFIVYENGLVTSVSPETDERIMLFARAVYFGCRHFSIFLDSLMLDFPFNHYIRRTKDSLFTLTFLPAGTGALFAYGTSVEITLSPSADSVVSTRITGNELKYFEADHPNDTIILDNTFSLVPSVANIFFVLMFNQQFPTISLVNKYSISTAQRPINNGGVLWEHTARK